VKNIIFLTTEQVLFIHDQMVKRFGGSFGVRDLGLVESAVARPKATFGGEYLYISIFDKAATLLQSLLKNHPFVDGNKRTAWLSTKRFLYINSYHLKAERMKAADFMVWVDNKKPEIGKISSWLRKHSKKMG